MDESDLDEDEAESIDSDDDNLYSDGNEEGGADAARVKEHALR